MTVNWAVARKFHAGRWAHPIESERKERPAVSRGELAVTDPKLLGGVFVERASHMK